MTLYLNPPNGNISLAKLHDYCEKRLTFLIKVHECRGGYIAMKDLTETEVHAIKSDCIIAGTVKDAISHFTIRMALCGDPETAKFLVEAESLLFSFRFSCMNEAEMLKFFTSTNRRITHFKKSSPKLDRLTDTLSIFSQLAQHVSWSDLARHCFEGNSDVFVTVPYEYALDLVANRSVELVKGLASVTCSHLHQVVTGLFKSVIWEGVRLARKAFDESGHHGDTRIQRLFRRLQYVAEKHCKRWCPPSTLDCLHVTANEVNELSQHFPLCMTTLHRALRSSHRLTHHARIQYTLFLKEVGLPVHEAIKFWRDEYSQEGCHGSTCTHAWSKEERRYTYNIRHLYGLEGSRINYRGHSCCAIQGSQLSYRGEGGCPYVHYDAVHLTRALEEAGIEASAIQHIVKLQTANNIHEACSSHFDFIKRRTKKNGSLSETLGVKPALNKNEEINELKVQPVSTGWSGSVKRKCDVLESSPEESTTALNQVSEEQSVQEHVKFTSQESSFIDTLTLRLDLGIPPLTVLSEESISGLVEEQNVDLKQTDGEVSAVHLNEYCSGSDDIHNSVDSGFCTQSICSLPENNSTENSSSQLCPTTGDIRERILETSIGDIEKSFPSFTEENCSKNDAPIKKATCMVDCTDVGVKTEKMLPSFEIVKPIDFFIHLREVCGDKISPVT